MKRRITEILTLLVALCISVVLAVALILWAQRLQGLTASAELVAAQSLPQPSIEPTLWDETRAPNYWELHGEALCDYDIPAGHVVYSPLDEHGRAGRVVARINYSMMEAGLARERTDMQDLKPSGWGHNREVSIELSGGRSYHGWLWNRSHLLAKSLGGQDRIENLVCGTRTQNVGANDGDGGMAYAESLVRAWLSRHKTGTVYYSATPLYVGDELVCRSVVVDIYSDDGELNVELEIFNAAKGFELNYATGSFQESQAN